MRKREHERGRLFWKRRENVRKGRKGTCSGQGSRGVLPTACHPVQQMKGRIERSIGGHLTDKERRQGRDIFENAGDFLAT